VHGLKAARRGFAIGTIREWRSRQFLAGRAGAPPAVIFGDRFGDREPRLPPPGTRHSLESAVRVQRSPESFFAQHLCDHSEAQPVYAPNSYGGPQAEPSRGADLSWTVEASELGRYAYEKHVQDDDFGQAGALYRDVLNETDREHLAANIVGHASDDVSRDVQMRVIAYWTSVDAHLGATVAAGLGLGGIVLGRRRSWSLLALTAPDVRRLSAGSGAAEQPGYHSQRAGVWPAPVHQ